MSQQQPRTPITFQKYSDYIKSTKPKKKNATKRTQQDPGVARHVRRRGPYRRG